MSRHQDWNINAKIYVGSLGNNVSKYELEDIFNRYGKLKNVWVARNPPGFAFVEFEDERDAEDAVKALDGTRICGNRAVVEMSNGRSPDCSGRGGGGGCCGRDRSGDRRGGRDDRGGSSRDERGGSSRDDRGARDG